MAGIYIHIPFCKSRCYYCDFYSTTDLWLISEYIKALKLELTDRIEYLNEKVETIYFGGGTPSVLQPRLVQELIETIYSNYNIADNPEITIEANPDDLTDRYLNELAKTYINRLSIGIQSLDPYYLKLMNRRHSSGQAGMSIKLAQKHGFNNISVDIIFGIPNMTKEELLSTLEKLGKLNVHHLSAYHLTYADSTVFHSLKEQGVMVPVGDDESYEQYMHIIDWSNNNGFVHYEISNFGKSGYFSKHNSNYWKGIPYLGVGVSAHSYNGTSRQWNVSNINKYLDYKNQRSTIFEIETLSTNHKFNELLLTSLRTTQGLDIDRIRIEFGNDKAQMVLSVAERYEKSGYLFFDNNIAILNDRGLFISDRIISDMFVC